MTAPLERAEARIEAALTQLGAEHEPPAGWEARVLAAVRTEQTQRPWWRIAVPALTLATAAGVAVLLLWPRHNPFVFDVVPESPTRVRGEPQGAERSLHDVVHVAVSGGAGHRALRVYRNETDLVLACPGDPACRISGGGIKVDFTLDKIGDYAIVAIDASDALPAMSGTYDADTAALRRAGAAVSEHKLRAF